MEIIVGMQENFKLTANFEGYTIYCDQPLSNNGEGSAPSPFDYFLASTALCAGYFVKAYCKTRDISTEGIKIIQNNVKDPENKFKHSFIIDVKVPEHFSDKDREGILRAIEGCSVKKAIQQLPQFEVKVHS